MSSAPGWPPVIGHRGAAKWAPENTLASFFCAADQGAPWVELDARLCKGGIPVVFHDATLERTTNGLGPVGEHRLDELRSLDAGCWFSRSFKDEPIPALDEALAAIARLGLGVNVEIKPDDGNAGEAAERVLEVVERVWPEEAPPPLISSFSAPVLQAVRRLGEGWRIGYLADSFAETDFALAVKLGAASFNLAESRVTPQAAARIRAAGMGLLAYTVNDPARALELRRMGVDGVFTDDPKSLLFL